MFYFHNILIMSVRPSRQKRRASYITRVEDPESLANPVLNTQEDPYIEPAIPFEFKEAETEQPIYRWVLYDELSQKQEESLPLNIILKVRTFKNQLRDGMRYLPDHYPPKIVIGQNINKRRDLKCILHSNPHYKRTSGGIFPVSERDGISFASEFIYPYHDENGPSNEGIPLQWRHLNRWAGGPPEQLSPMSPEELEWWLQQIPPKQRNSLNPNSKLKR